MMKSQSIKKKFLDWLNKAWPLLVVLAIVLLASWSLLQKGYFTMHDDVQVMRLFQMEKCFQDGQIPCRWVSDMGAGYGHPLYNFHPVLAYYLGMVFRLFGFSFIAVAKILFLLTYLLAALFMYLLVKEFFGPLAGAVGAAFFTLAPYHALDVYVRGAMTESWGIVFFPLIFWALYKLVKEKKFLFFLLSVGGLTGLFLAHNIMTLLFAPIAFAWAVFWLWQEKSWRQWRRWLPILSAFSWAFGLSAFFLLPAFFERSLVKIETLTSDYYNFRHHFATLHQLFFDRAWEYGPSRPGPEDSMSFQLGWPHWWTAILSGVVFLYTFLLKLLKEKKGKEGKRGKKKEVLQKSLFFFLPLFGFGVLMTHAKSVAIWELSSLISFVQFPWRFLALAMFVGSFLTASLVYFFKGRARVVVSLVLLGLLIFFNVGYFKPDEYLPEMTDQGKLSGKEWQIQSMATLMDYMPQQIEEIPQALAPAQPWVVEGQARVSEYRRRSNFWRFSIEVVGDEPALVEVPIFDFPYWQVLINQRKVEHSANEKTGVIQIQVPPGKQTVVGWLENTPLRTAANTLTVVSFAGLFLLTVFVNGKKKDGKDKKAV